MEKPEAPVGKPNSLCHFFWKASENVAVKWGHFSRSWAVIGGDETFLLFQSVQLIWIYFVAA